MFDINPFVDVAINKNNWNQMNPLHHWKRCETLLSSIDQITSTPPKTQINLQKVPSNNNHNHNHNKKKKNKKPDLLRYQALQLPQTFLKETKAWCCFGSV